MNDLSFLDIDPVACGMSAEGMASLATDGLALAKRLAEEIRSLKEAPDGALSWDATCGKLDAITVALQNVMGISQLMSVTHPDAAVRDAAKAADPLVEQFVTALYMDAEIASVFKRYAARNEALPPDRARFLEFTLRDYRRNGLDLPPEKQQRLREMNEELTKTGQAFDMNLAEASPAIEVTPEQLDGLPQAYRDSHKPDTNGKVRISTDYPDYTPFMMYAKDRAAARELYIINANRTYAANLPLLERLLALRDEKAKLLGYPTWADYSLEVKMAKTSGRVRSFLDGLHQSLKAKTVEEMQMFREMAAKLGIAEPVSAPDAAYIQDYIFHERFSLDTQALSEYFDVQRVRDGILDIASRLYGITFRVAQIPTWHEDVVAYDVVDGDVMFGRIFVDLYPRPGKYKHAAVFPVRETRKRADGSRAMPLAALVCNFPKPGTSAALLRHGEVTTFFHEFGHALHAILSQASLASFAGTNVARDFVEAPSQMFEEWAWSREILDRFAVHHVTGERIPDALFAAMTSSRTFGEAISTQRQLFLATLDLTYHTHAPGFDTTAVMERLFTEFNPFAFVSGTHFQTSFGHLVGYDAGYYGYQWALSISRDLFTRFETEGLMNPTTARGYRNAILEPGGGLDEDAMVTQFLGRPPSDEAYKKFLGITTP